MNSSYNFTRYYEITYKNLILSFQKKFSNNLFKLKLQKTHSTSQF